MEVRSPNSDWVAVARSEQWSGPGNAYDATTVAVTHGKLPATDALVFSHQNPTMRLTMKWLTPTHLDVTYGPVLGDSVSLDYEVARTSGIQISVQRLATASVR